MAHLLKWHIFSCASTPDTADFPKEQVNDVSAPATPGNVLCAAYFTVCGIFLNIQDVPGVKVTTSGFNSRVDSEPKPSYTHGSNSQWFRSYELLKYSK